MAARYSLLTFCISTELSPSAVIPACANPMTDPKRLTERYPCPPQRSRAAVPLSLQFHAHSGLIAQQSITTSRATSLGGVGVVPNPAQAAQRSFT